MTPDERAELDARAVGFAVLLALVLVLLVVVATLVDGQEPYRSQCSGCAAWRQQPAGQSSYDRRAAGRSVVQRITTNGPETLPR